MTVEEASPPPGAGVLRASLVGTGVFAATAAAATALPALGLVPLIVDPLLFLAGVVAFVLTFVRAAARSRTEEIGLMALFMLEGATAPRPVKRLLLASFGAEVAIAFATAALRPNTTVAFGILVPVYGLSVMGLWAARHGSFNERPPPGRGAGRAGRAAE